MAQYTITCDVRLTGAIMVVNADSEAEALEIAKGEGWADIEYDGANLSDWTLTGKPKLDE